MNISKFSPILGTFKQLLKGGLKINNEPLMFLNDLDVVNEDLIIFTDSSSRWDRRRFFSILLEAIPNGRCTLKFVLFL